MDLSSTAVAVSVLLSLCSAILADLFQAANEGSFPGDQYGRQRPLPVKVVFTRWMATRPQAYGVMKEFLVCWGETSRGPSIWFQRAALHLSTEAS